MFRCITIIATMLAVSACADRSWPNAELSGDSPANFYFRSDTQNALALIAAAEEGRAVTWTVSSSSYGKVVPAAAQFSDRAGRPCRVLKQDRAGGRDDDFSREVVACKDGHGIGDGLWVVSEYVPEKAD